MKERADKHQSTTTITKGHADADPPVIFEASARVVQPVCHRVAPQGYALASTTSRVGALVLKR